MVVSCSFSFHDTSVTAKLDAVDNFISQGQSSDAIKILKKLQKKPANAFVSIGIYRRYMQLGRSDDAEAVLRKALEKNDTNLDLNAIYTHFLLRLQRYDDALPYAVRLVGTDYASLYSELQLKQALLNSQNTDYFYDATNIPLYKAAYDVTHDTRWLRNAAALSLLKGDSTLAVSFLPKNLPSAWDAYFWALVLYDAGKISESAACLDTLSQYPGMAENRMQDLSIQAGLLRSDIFVTIGDQESAEKERQRIIALGVHDPAIYVNSAYWARKNKNLIKEYELLQHAVTEWPDYVPALSAYSDYAYQTSQPYVDDEYTKMIRASGLQTIDMQNYEAIPRVPFKTVLNMIDDSLSRTQDPVLYLIKMALNYKMQPTTDIKAQLIDIWRLLENNQIGTDMYPDPLMHYAMHLLLVTHSYDDAVPLLKKFFYHKYAFVPDIDYWDQVVVASEKMALWEIEYASWVAAYEKLRSVSLRLFEKAVYESSKWSDEKISTLVSSQTATNLAMVYESLGNEKKSLELYNITSGLTMDLSLKSEILYRIACIDRREHRLEDAKRALQYAVSLDPYNERAQLLLSSMH